MMWPQITMIVLILIEMCCAARLHGKPRDNYNFWYWLVGQVILVTLLYYGDFWHF